MITVIFWDIDGTLLQRASAEHARALLRALCEVHGEGLSFDSARLDAALTGASAQ